MELSLSLDLEHYLTEQYDTLVELIRTLCAIPAPSNLEQKRAAFCKEWLEKQGAKGVYVDDADNVIYPVGCEDGKPVVIFMAHTDTVFPDLEPMPLREEAGRMYCPGVGDDTANLAVLLMLANYVIQHGCKPKVGVLFVANSGEEGLGNLRGSRQLMKEYGSRVQQVISFDGYYGGIANNAVGSTRYKVEVLTEGGHSFGNFGNRNAIEYLASMIETLYTMKVPDKAKTTYNVGTMQGGTSVNTIAQQAEMLYEYRSEDQECLAIMKRFFDATVESYRAMGVKVNVSILGERPCKGEVDPAALDALTARCVEVTRRFTNVAEPHIEASSTDCNIPLSLGIPALTTGVCLGGGAHTRGEWIDLESLKPGCRVAAALVMDWFL